jgi:butyrate kinase
VILSKVSGIPSAKFDEDVHALRTRANRRRFAVQQGEQPRSKKIVVARFVVARHNPEPVRAQCKCIDDKRVAPSMNDLAVKGDVA